MALEQIGRYQVQSQLGQGGMATVFAANDPSFERQVAIKLLPREFLHDPSFRQRFEREAKIVAGLEHVAIVPVYDFGEQDGQPYLVMRLMSGGSLADRIAQGPIPLAETLNIVERVGSALATAHAKGIVHRDIKPSNFLFDQHGAIYVADFGIARLAESAERLTGSGVVGTPAYMAPEMTRPGGLSPLVDIYAVGVTLYEMLTGSRPFHADTPVGLMLAHHTAQIPDIRQTRADIPEGAQTVIERALAKDPALRYQTMTELVDDFRAAVSGEMSYEPVAGPMPARAARPGRRALARPIQIALGALALLALGGAALLLPSLAGSPSGALGSAANATEGSSSPPADLPTPTVAAPGPIESSLRPFGTVEVQAGGSQIAQPATSVRDLAVGDTVRTGADGVALIIFDAEITVELHPNSTLQIARADNEADGLAIRLAQEAGVSFHSLAPDGGAQPFSIKAYQVSTPVATAIATGGRFWTAETAGAWQFAPIEGQLVIDLGEADDNPDDDRLVDRDCLLVGADGPAPDCDIANAGLALLTDGANLLPTLAASATLTETLSARAPVEGPTATVSVANTLEPTLAPTSGECGVCAAGGTAFVGPGECGIDCSVTSPGTRCCRLESYDACGKLCRVANVCTFTLC